MSCPTLYTVGHGARSLAALLAVLQQVGVQLLVDVRRYPGSRRHPQYGREPLAAGLAEAGVEYQWWGETLGGRRSRSSDSRHIALRHAAFAGYADHMDGPEFRAAVQALLAEAARQRTAVMCAETPWWRCHRRLVADALLLQGAQVRHLLEVGRHQPHEQHPNARRADDGWPVYDVPDALPGL